MADDLVKRLRDWPVTGITTHEAADRIEQLGRERDAAIAALEESGRKRGETEALLDTALEALRYYASCPIHDIREVARAALTEIEGGKKDD